MHEVCDFPNLFVTLVSADWSGCLEMVVSEFGEHSLHVGNGGRYNQTGLAATCLLVILLPAPSSTQEHWTHLRDVLCHHVMPRTFHLP